MGLDFAFPWALLLVPVGVLAVLFIDRRYQTRKRSLKRRVSLWLRLLLTFVLAFAVASPSILISAGKATRWVLLDVSDSASAVQPDMQEALQAALSTLPAGEEAGVIVFGRDAMVETPLNQTPVFTGVHAAVAADGSNLNAALSLASALMPSEGAGGITVISDGQVTVSSAIASLLSSRGIRVDTLSYEVSQDKDAQLSELVVPAGVFEGQTISLQAVIDASAAMSGTLVLSQNGEPTAQREVKLEKGENRFVFTDIAKQTGVVIYEARLLCGEDSESRNNSASAYARVSGVPKVLLISQTNAIGRLFAASGIQVTCVRSEELPLGTDGYLAYDAIVLNNIDYDAATHSQWQALSAAVRTLGRGLCVLGGDSSYAMGGYRGTALEELLPVTIDVRDKLQMPALSLIIAIDKSGSMTAGQYGTTRIEVAKEAAMSAVEVLSERDKIGVIGFDEAAKWVVPFQNATELNAIQTMIGTIRADGGTAFFSPLSVAYEALASAGTPQKHVIFLSDGEPGDTGFEKVALGMAKAGITLTTVAVGNGADTKLMDLLSTLGGGRSYAAGEFDNIPKIFTKETMLAGGSYVQNRAFTPVINENSALTSYDGFPMLTGYLTTVEKSTATVSLSSDTEDPVLAWWNVGAGKTIAWMSDAEGAWTEQYLRWEKASDFFGGMIAKVLPGADRAGTLSATADGEQLNISYVTGAQGEENTLLTVATIVAPDGTQQQLALCEVEPGKYEGTARAKQQGAYALSIAQTRDGAMLRSQEGGAVKRYAYEYDLRKVSGAGIAQLSQQTGGRVIQAGEGFWNTKIKTATARKQTQTLLCILALILLIADIALRKLAWEDAVRKALAKLASREKRVQRQTGADGGASASNVGESSHSASTAAGKHKVRAACEQAKKEAAAQTADALLLAKRAREKR